MAFHNLPFYFALLAGMKLYTDTVYMELLQVLTQVPLGTDGVYMEI